MCFISQMESPLLLLLLLFLQLGFGQSSGREDHYIGQQHNPQRDVNVLLGDEVFKYNNFLWQKMFGMFALYSFIGLLSTRTLKK